MLPDGEAHIWLASPDALAASEVKARCESLLSEDELAASRRFYFERDRHLYIAAHALVRTMLSHFAPVSPEDWRFRCNQYGRPEIDAETSLRFNLSHTPGLVACLVTNKLDAGVDVERRREQSDTMAIANRFFSPTEVADLNRVPAEQRRLRFYELWTLKEAYIKARGMGLALPLSGFSYRIEASISLSVSPDLNDDGIEWQFGLETPTSEHQLAWAIRKGTRTRSLPVYFETVPSHRLALS